MAAGLPIVATRAGGISELIRDGEDGLLVDPQDPAGLADSLGRILVGSRSRPPARRSSARARQLAEHDLDRTIGRLADLYEALYERAQRDRDRQRRRPVAAAFALRLDQPQVGKRLGDLGRRRLVPRFADPQPLELE